MSTRLSAINPYYDDYDIKKGFHQILFRPGLAVQARELTQLQTILDNQIEQFGSHIFKEGSIVVGGGVTTSTETTIELAGITVGGVEIDITNFYANGAKVDLTGTYAIVGTGANVYIGKVLLCIGKTETTNNKIVVKLERFEFGSNGDYVSDIDGETVYFQDESGLSAHYIVNDDDPNTTAILPASIITLPAVGSITPYDTFIASVDQGITYTRGSFVYNEPMVGVIKRGDKSTLDAIVGFNVVDEIITAYDDPTLLDPAQGSYNYAAPGADRLARYLELAVVDWPDENVTDYIAGPDFIELLRVKNGEPYVTRRVPIYSGLADTLARRTYDESGHYTVQPFRVSVDPVDPADDSFNLSISTGKAYVKGYEIEKYLPSKIEVRKAQDTETVEGYDVVTSLGNYVNVTVRNGVTNAALPNLNAPVQLEIHNAATPVTTTKIGTAFARALEKFGNNYRLYLFEINITSSSFENARTFKIGNLILDIVLVDNKAVRYNTADTASLFPLPQSNISETDRFEFYTRRYFNNYSLSASNTITITTSSSKERFADPGDKNFGYIVYDKTTGTIVDMTTGGRGITPQTPDANSPDTAVLQFVATDAGHTFDIIALVEYADQAQRTKTVIVSSVSISNATTGNKYSLGVVDGIEAAAFNNDNLIEKAGTYAINNGACVVTIPSFTYDGSKKYYFSFNNNAYYSGIYDIIAYTDTTLTINVPFSGSGNVTVSLGNVVECEFDGGQSDMYYDVATIKPKTAANIKIFVKHFTRSPGFSPFSASSYVQAGAVGSIPLYKIPTYQSRFTSNTYNLGDVLDFRVDRVNFAAAGAVYTSLSSNSFVGADALVPSPWQSTVSSDYSYYLQRVDLLVLMPTGDFRIIEGTSSLFYPKAPKQLPDAMTVAQINIEAGTSQTDDVKIILFENRRYTMKDIGLLDSRITYVEQHCCLDGVEQSLAMTSLTNSSGDQLTVVGFGADSVNNSLADPYHPEFRLTYDVNRKVMEPRRTFDYIDLEVKSTTGKLHSNKTVTLPYTETRFITQDKATSCVSVNYYLQQTWKGTLTLVPAQDSWVDNVTTGTTVYTPTSVMSGPTIDTVVDQRVTSVTATSIPWIRSRNVDFRVDGVKPYSQMRLYFDGVDITSIATNLVNGYIKANATGSAAGSFVIPNNSTLRFSTGTKPVVVTEALNLNDVDIGDSYASATYTATGTLITTNIQTTIDRKSPPPPPPPPQDFNSDPLAQTFFVDSRTEPNGIFITSIDLFFAKKSNSLPVWVQLRPTVNGYPSSKEILATSTVQASNVSTSLNGTARTKFTFDAPVYFAPGEYSFVVVSDSPDYCLWRAVVGQNDILTNEMISRQPMLGSMFASQNSSTWTAWQESDITFIINKAKFSTGEQTINLQPEANPTKDIEYSRLLAQNIDYLMGSSTSASYKWKAVNPDSTTVTHSINTGSEHSFAAVYEHTAKADGTEMIITFNSTDENVSPIIDVAAASVLVSGFTINNDMHTGQVPETTISSGTAEAKYISKVVTIPIDIEATALKIFVEGYKPKGANFDVYVKLLNSADNKPFDQKPWTQIPITASTTTDTAAGPRTAVQAFIENVTYIDGVEYEGFKSFMIKVVLWSSSDVDVPFIEMVGYQAGV